MQDKTRIDEILSYAVGRDVPVVDAFCLGKQKRPTTDQSVEGNSESRPRPVLVKLGCVWDCRVVLLAEHKLQDFEGGKYFVCAEMSADEQAKRKKHWMDRKQTAAQNQCCCNILDSHHITVSDGITVRNDVWICYLFITLIFCSFRSTGY